MNIKQKWICIEKFNTKSKMYLFLPAITGIEFDLIAIDSQTRQRIVTTDKPCVVACGGLAYTTSDSEGKKVLCAVLKRLKNVYEYKYPKDK